ncbi:TTC6 isoform 1, partial [Pan troglodytes]
MKAQSTASMPPARPAPRAFPAPQPGRREDTLRLKALRC